MVTKWGMGHDPEATDKGATGRGVLTTLVGDTSVGFSRDVRDAQARAIRSILDDAYTSARRTLIAEMPRLRDVAAYLYEQERIDGDEFEAVMAGRLRSADGEGWRAAAASPRAWDAIPDHLRRAPAGDRPRAGVARGAAPRADPEGRAGTRARARCPRPRPSQAIGRRRGLDARVDGSSRLAGCPRCPVDCDAPSPRSCATSPKTPIAETSAEGSRPKSSWSA